MLRGMDTTLLQHQCSTIADLSTRKNLSSHGAAPEVLCRKNTATFSKCAGILGHLTPRICALRSEQLSARKSKASGNRSTSKANAKNALNVISYEPTSPTHEATVSEGLLVLLGELSGDQAQGHHVSEIRSQVQELVDTIKAQLSDLAENEGVIATSAYDTAWVARVPALDGSPAPQFPETVNWVLRNQLHDGSWGDRIVDVASDRLLSTLACVVALATWKTGQKHIQKGVEYLWSNMGRLKGTAGVQIPVGYELIFPTLMEDAKDLGLKLPYDSEVVQNLKDMGSKKRQRIPLEMLYARATTLMFSLEGLKGLDIDWKRVLKLQISDGSMMASPAATAFALVETGDSKCQAYLENLIRKFDGAVPNFYPFDNFQILWTVDVLERLGIARYFQDEIEMALASLYRNWSDKVGVAWTRVIDLVDIDDTSMAFRILRMHGYEVDEGVFKHFRRDGEFVCYEGQLIQGLSDMFTLYRATEIHFPGEKTIEEAHKCSKNFLENALTNNMTNADKWSIKKDFYGEVQRRLNYPLHSVLPRLEINDYVERYGVDDPWVAKAVYRMRLPGIYCWHEEDAYELRRPGSSTEYHVVGYFLDYRLPLVNNKNYLALAKADARLCQSYYLKELLEISEWLGSSGLDSSLYERALQSYLVFAAEIWEPEYSTVRTVAAKSAILAMCLRKVFDESHPNLRGHVQVFIEALARWEPETVSNLPNKFQTLFMALWQTLNTFIEQAFRIQGRDISTNIRSTWQRFATALENESEWRRSATVPELEEYMHNARVTLGAEPPILTSFFFTDVMVDDSSLAQIDCRSDFWKNSCSYARLHIDLGSSEENVPATYTGEYSTLSRTEVYELLQSQKQDLLSELNRSMWGSSSSGIPNICRRLVKSISRIIPKISGLGGHSQNTAYFTAEEKQLLFQLHVQDTKSNRRLECNNQVAQNL